MVHRVNKQKQFSGHNKTNAEVVVAAASRVVVDGMRIQVS